MLAEAVGLSISVKYTSISNLLANIFLVLADRYELSTVNRDVAGSSPVTLLFRH